MADRDDETQLPPAFVKLTTALKADRKTLLRDKAYGQNPEQLRAFIAQFLYPRLEEMVNLMGLALYDTYGLAVSTENQVQRMRAVFGSALKKLGADVEDEDGELPGVSPEVLDEFEQKFYTLGTLLQKKLPEDKEVEGVYNDCAKLLAEMVDELLGGEEDDEPDDEPEPGDAKPDDSAPTDGGGEKV